MKSPSDPDGNLAGQAPVLTGSASDQTSVTYIILLAMLLAGFSSLFLAEHPRDYLASAYHLLGLFSGNSEWVFGEKTASPSRVIRLLAVVAPLVSLLALVGLFSDWVRLLRLRWLAGFKLAFCKYQCIALIGLSRQSLDLAISIQGSSAERMLPIVLADDADPGLARQCTRAGIALFGRHARHLKPKLPWHSQRPSRLRVKRILDRAWGIVSFLPTAHAQLDFIHELTSWQPIIKSATSRVWVLLDDRGLAQRLEDHVGRLGGRVAKRSMQVVPRLLTLNMLRARHLLSSHQFDTLADAFGQARIHIVIYGLGAMGRAIVKEAAQLYVTRPSLAGVKVKITYFDRDPAEAEAALLGEDPGIATVIDLVGRKLHLSPAGLLEKQVCLLPDHVTAHVIGLGDAASAFNLAVSLRRWLLEPPMSVDRKNAPHGAAPIFVRSPSARGLGLLFCKRPGTVPSDEGAPIPDGIFGYGAIEDVFGAPDAGLAPVASIFDPDSENGARMLHAAYRRGRPGILEAADTGAKRTAEAEWCELPSSLRESNFRAYDHIAIKARAVGWRFVKNTSSSPKVREFSPKQVGELARLEHWRYMAERSANGWRCAPHRLDSVRVHPDLVDWKLLAHAEQQLDSLQVEALPSVAMTVHHDLARALVLGVLGQRTHSMLGEEVRPLLERELQNRKAESDRALIVVTTLAPGPESWIAELAIKLTIPFLAVLPLPYELYQEDFQGEGALHHFRDLASRAELQIELPMRFGRASELTRCLQGMADENLQRRHRQYALADAYIVERADALIAVSNGGIHKNDEDVANAVHWWTAGVPADYATHSHFFVRPQSSGRPAPFVIKPPFFRRSARDF